MKSIHGKLLLPSALALLVAACGGGSSGDSSSAPPAGSTKTVLVTGTISGFGSVIVNGVHYDTSTATVRIDDQPSSDDLLEVGEVIRLEAEVDDQGRARAKLIEQDHLLEGTVEAVDVAGGTLLIAGQVVRVDGDTSFDDSIVPRNLGGLRVGQRVEVSGLVGADGVIAATRVERKAAVATVEVKGATVTALRVVPVEGGWLAQTVVDV